MPGMKRDCGGAAGILGAFWAAVKAVCPFKPGFHVVIFGALQRFLLSKYEALRVSIDAYFVVIMYL